MNVAQQLVEHFGGVDQTAQTLNINRETLRLWLRDGIPPKRWLEIEKRTSGAITADQLLEEARQQ
jgi:hypothetical protein